jgi:ATP-dependent RNA helicase DDX27
MLYVAAKIWHRTVLKTYMESFLQESKGRNKAKKGQSIVDVAYRRAKSKATGKRVPDAGKGKIDKKGKQHSDKAPSRQEEMHDLFQNDMSEWKQGQFSTQEIK